MSATRRLGRPSTNVRVPDLDPSEVALSFARECLRHSEQHAGLLAPLVTAEPDAYSDAIAQTDLYKRVKRLAEYAVLGTGLRGSVESTVKPLEVFAKCPLWDRADIDRVRKSVDTQQGSSSAIALIIVAAFAREKLQAGEPITSSELAALGGVTRTTIGTAAREKQFKTTGTARPGSGGEYIIAAAEAVRWLRDREVSGFAGASPPARPRRSAREK